jgi:AbrB family looped-hinge helix DNA binding protein
MTQLTDTVRLVEGGRNVIPAACRNLLNVKPGDQVIFELEDGAIRLRTRAEGIRRAQAIRGKYARKGPPIIAELIAEHRLEAGNVVND